MALTFFKKKKVKGTNVHPSELVEREIHFFSFHIVKKLYFYLLMTVMTEASLLIFRSLVYKV